MLDIPYINAMIIFRTYKSDNKIVSHAKQHKTNESYSPFLKDGTLSMERLRAKTTDILLKAIDNKQFTDKEINKIMAANPEILLSISSLGAAGYDFDETFKIVTNESTGK